MTFLQKLPLGVLLAGGLAQRMNGSKAMRQIGGKSLLERALNRLAPQCDGLILNANGDARQFVSSGLTVVPDNVEGFLGPLAGLLAALDWASTHKPEIEWVLSAPVDAPFLPRDLATRLQYARASQNTDLAIAASGGRIHPVIGLWRVGLRHDLRQALMSDNIRKVSSWIARHSSAIVEWRIEPLDPFFNVNTMEDLATAERLAAIDCS